MANTTYLSLTNQLLRRLNEVTIDEADFTSARGVQAMAKDVINASIQFINLTQFEWPFNAAQGTQVLTVGQETYSFPLNFKLVKWDSFYVENDDALATQGGPLRFISLDEYNMYRRNTDDLSGTDGIRVPRYVFPAHGGGFGVSPSPDQAYTVKYEYFRQQDPLVDYDDEPNIPTIYDETIIQGALYHFYMFRDNREQAADAEKMFKMWVGQMRTVLINNEDAVRSGMIAWGGGSKFHGNLVNNTSFGV